MILKKSIGLLQDACEYLVGERDSWRGAYCNLKNTRGPKQAKNKYINIKKTKMSMIRKTNGILYSPDKAEYE